MALEKVKNVCRKSQNLIHENFTTNSLFLFLKSSFIGATIATSDVSCMTRRVDLKKVTALFRFVSHLIERVYCLGRGIGDSNPPFSSQKNRDFCNDKVTIESRIRVAKSAVFVSIKSL